MDEGDIDREISSISLPGIKPVRRLDLAVKHANIKAALCKVIAVLFLVAVIAFAAYSVLNARTYNIDTRVAVVFSLVYVVLAAWVALRLFRLDFAGWLVMLVISLAGIAMPAFSAVNRGGIQIGTVPMIVVSFVLLAVLWWMRDMYKVYRIEDLYHSS